MDVICIELVAADNPAAPFQVPVSAHMSLKMFTALVEKVLGVEVFGLYVDRRKLADMGQLTEGATVVAVSTVSPNSTLNNLSKAEYTNGEEAQYPKESASGVRMAVMGPHNAGKTSLVLRFVHGLFKNNGISTVMESEFEKTVFVKGRNIRMEVHDTEGERDYDELALKRLGAMDAYALVIGVDQMDKWTEVVRYHKLVRRFNRNALILLVITKIDLYDNSEPRAAAETRVKLDFAAEYASEQRLLLIKTSAKTNKNIYKVFSTISDKFANPRAFAESHFGCQEPEPNCPFFFRMVERLMSYTAICGRVKR